jgi:hypothetical protein
VKKPKPPIELQAGAVDGRPYRVSWDDGWVVRAADGTNAFEPTWRWNTRSGARSFKWECEMLGHIPKQVAHRTKETDHDQ